MALSLVIYLPHVYGVGTAIARPSRELSVQRRLVLLSILWLVVGLPTVLLIRS